MTRARPLLIGLALAGVALLGYVVAQTALSSPRSTPRMAAVAGSKPSMAAGRSSRTTSTATSSTATTQGFVAHSGRGAVAAAVSYLRLLDQASVAAATLAQLRAVTWPPLTAQALRAEAASAALARKISTSGRAFVGGWRLGWQITSYTPTSAGVAVWTMGLLESSAAVLAPYWSTTTFTLHWSAGRWRVSSAKTGAGPTPPSDGIDRAAVASFVSSATAFHSFSDAP